MMKWIKNIAVINYEILFARDRYLDVGIMDQIHLHAFKSLYSDHCHRLTIQSRQPSTSAWDNKFRNHHNHAY